MLIGSKWSFHHFSLGSSFKPLVFIPDYSAEISSEKTFMNMRTVLRGQTKGSFIWYPVSNTGSKHQKSVSYSGTNRNGVKFKTIPVILS